MPWLISRYLKEDLQWKKFFFRKNSISHAPKNFFKCNELISKSCQLYPHISMYLIFIIDFSNSFGGSLLLGLILQGWRSKEPGDMKDCKDFVDTGVFQLFVEKGFWIFIFSFVFFLIIFFFILFLDGKVG